MDLLTLSLEREMSSDLSLVVSDIDVADIDITDIDSNKKERH
jgi:hypothetical protein